MLLKNFITFCLLCVTFSIYAQQSQIKFTHFYVEFPLEPDSYGTGGFTVNDFDRDGDMDITIQRHPTGKVYWYQNVGHEKWIKYEIASDIKNQLGATSFDVNRDGWEDLVMGAWWLENPKNLKENPAQPWIKHYYNGAMDDENHDVVGADIDGDGITDLVSYCQKYMNTRGTLRWYNLKDPHNWTYYDIDTFVNKREMPAWNNGIHAGFAPRGIGDLNNDGRADIVLPSGWYENPKDLVNGKWILHRWKDYGVNFGIPRTLYGTSMRSWIVDINGDRNNDIIVTDCDVENSKPYIIINRKGARKFKLKPLPFPNGPSGSLHSLALADMDGDGDLDIVSGEQEDPYKLMKPEGLAERGFIWINKKWLFWNYFKCQIIHENNPGWHDTILRDVDGDGDIDIVTKVWNADEGTDGNPDRKWHISYWRNDGKMKK